MRYGFKARAERISFEARQELGLSPTDPLDGARYAAYLEVGILEFDELDLSAGARRQLLEVDPESWSGMTIKADRRTGILVNPVHSAERQHSTITHELSHIILDHVPTRVDLGPGGIMLVSEYSEDDEAEADWLSGALLLPRDALLQCRIRGMTNAAIAGRYKVSGPLCEWRVRMTGIDAQLRRAAAR